MPIVTILPAGRRTCEENRARRAWASAHGRKPNRLLHTLGNLLPLLNTPRAVYERSAQEAMDAGDATRMLAAINAMCGELARCRTERDKLHKAMPLLYPQAA